MYMYIAKTGKNSIFRKIKIKIKEHFGKQFCNGGNTNTITCRSIITSELFGNHGGLLSPLKDRVFIYRRGLYHIGFPVVNG